MKILLVSFSVIVTATLGLPSDRWPNVGPTLGPTKQIVVITPTSEYAPPEYIHEIAPKKDAVYHANYAAIEEQYPSPHYTPVHYSPPQYSPPHYPPPTEKKKSRYDEKLLRKYYNNLVDNKVALKKNIIQKLVDKTIGATAKLTQYTVDFVSRVAIQTAAKLAKNGANNVIYKKAQKFSGDHDYH